MNAMLKADPGTLKKIGKISKLFGNDGEITMNLYDDFPATINYKEPLYVVIDMLAVPLFFDSFERRGRNGALVRFADIDTPLRARELVGLDIFMKNLTAEASRENTDGELYFEDLVGYVAMIGEAGGDVFRSGEITGYVDSEMNPLFAISLQGTEMLIPAADEFIESVDTDSKEVKFLLPEGLLELYL